MSKIDKEEIVRLTEEYGGQWGINHTRRLLQLISIIGAGLEYNAEVIWMAAHLHDWGGYPKWMQPGADHALRSRQVAEEFLVEKGYAPELLTPILECIEYHQGSDPKTADGSYITKRCRRVGFFGGGEGAARFFEEAR